MSKKKDETAPAPAPTGPEISAVYLLAPVHIKTAIVDGTISPYSNKDHEKYQLFDEGRFLQIRVRETSIVRNVPWMHVRHWTPMGAE
jgi:translation elongation factor P/translation initiation factor 5A